MKIQRIGLLAGSLFGLLTLFLSPIASAETVTPYITIEAPINGTLFEVQSDVTLTGSANPNSKIVLTAKDGEYASFTSDANGRWSYTIPTVTEGSHTLMATVHVSISSLSTETNSANVTYVVSQPSSVTDVRKLAETGLLLALAIPAGVILLAIAIYTYIDYRRHRRPLVQADPKAKYSFWHHIHVVSLPLLRYRLSINVDRRLPSRSEQVRRY